MFTVMTTVARAGAGVKWIWSCALIVCALADSHETRGQLTQPANTDVSARQANVIGASATPADMGEGASPQGALTAIEISSTLEEHPELRDELKQQIALRLQSQGMGVQAEEISDDVLYQQIESSAQVRALVTRYLVARGVAPSQSKTSGPTRSSGTMREDNQNNAAWSSRGNTECRSGELCWPAAVKEAEASDVASAPAAIRKPPPYPLQSMRDLYTQLPDGAKPLKRFGSEFFLNSHALLRGAAPGDAPLDMPVGPDYVVGGGDSLEISIWGASTETVSRVVGRDGRVMLPDAGAVQVGGLTLGRAEAAIGAALKQQLRNVQVAVAVTHFHTVRIYVAGDVQRPGGYDVSAMATPLSALYAAGGPTAAGSLRTVRHLRGADLVEQIDLYAFLLHGVHTSPVRLESGDTLLVPPAGAQVAVSGAVKRPAVYELKEMPESLEQVVSDAGGFAASASVSHISVERVNQYVGRETVTVGVPQAGNEDEVLRAIREFSVRDGDRIVIAPVLPYSERLVYLEGHVARPGRQPFRDGMRLSDVVHSYADLLPEPAQNVELVRLVGPDLHAETMDLDLREALIGNVNPTLQPFDTIRVRGRYDEDPPEVTVRGEVLRPGVYPLSEGMTAGQLVRMAGGLKRDALLERADIASYSITDAHEVQGKLRSVPIGAAVKGEAPDVRLQPGDILSVHQITGWADIGEAVTLDGQVKFPGSYGFSEGERLSSVLRRAGGFRPSAYPEGAVLTREQVRDLEAKSRDELIRQIETNSAAARLSPNLSGGDAGQSLQLIKAQQEQVIEQLKSHPPTGRLVVHLTADIDSWANTPADIELRSGDVLTIPKRPGFVMVTGQVYNSTAITFTPEKSAGWYLARAGGANTTANRKEIFVVRANGSVVGRRSTGRFTADVLSLTLDPGDVVVVPQKIVGNSLVWRNLLASAQLASSLAITAAVAGL